MKKPFTIYLDEELKSKLKKIAKEKTKDGARYYSSTIIEGLIIEYISEYENPPIDIVLDSKERLIRGSENIDEFIGKDLKDI